MKRIILTLALCGFATTVATTAFAQSDENILVGSRPIALGGAFTAVADDVNAMFYNPAGLQFLRQHEVTYVNAELFGTGVSTSYLSYALPISQKQAIGIDWQHIGYGDPELGYNRDIIKAAFSREMHSRVSIGGSFKFLMTNTSLDGTSVGKATGVGFDLGLLYSPMSRLRLGVNVHNVSGTRIKFDGGGSETVMPRAIRVGAAWQANDKLLLATDLDRKVHLGGEYRFHEALTLRMGTQKDMKTSDPFELTFGMGLHYRALKFDFTHTPGKRGLGQTQRYGFMASFEPSPHLIKVIETQSDILYASYYKAFEKSAGSLTLHNRHGEPLDCTVLAQVPSISDEVAEIRVLLAPKKTVAVPFEVVLSERVMQLAEDRRITVDVRIEYATGRTQKSIKRSITAMAFRPGSIVWDTSGKAAAFVTHDDPVVEKFARDVYSRFPEDPPKGMPFKVYQAMLLFDALSEYGMRYVQDPKNPFSQVVENADYVDRISYPSQTLKNRTGDCDDQVVAYCALLENLNIPGAFVEPEGHLLMMFDTGMNVMQDDESNFVVEYYDWMFDAKDGTLWLPVEVTLLGDSFMAAWKRGVEQIQILRRKQQMEWMPVRQAWAQFPPAAPPEETWSPQVPAKEAMEGRVQADIRDILKRLQ